ncbi:L-aspartate--L-methionine ligase LdmS [Rummeliibacillus sp. JY-2-4R]
MNRLKIKPKYTLKQLYGEDVVYCSRTSFRENPWMPQDTDQSNFLTAREIVISDLPTLVHKATQTNKAKQLFNILGINLPEQPYQFENAKEYAAVLKTWEKEQKEIVFHYIHDEDEIARDLYWMDADVFNYLNSKAYLGEIVPEQFVPRRVVINGNKLVDELKSWSTPLILKPGDDTPTSGGYGVMICYTDEQLQVAIERFQEEQTETIIIEEMLDAKDNYSCQYLYSEDLGIRYLGASEQLTDADGYYNGNILVNSVPQEVIDAGRKIMEFGVKKGFKGIAGFDLIVTNDGKIKAIDLNFRQNGSTSMLILHEQLGKSANKFLSYCSRGDNESFYKAIQYFIEKGVLFPLCYYDGDYFDVPVNSRFTGIWYADTLEEIEQYEKQLNDSGVTC